MAKNKIVYGSEVLLDISGDTAVEADVMSGKTFHKADGTQATGTMADINELLKTIMSMTTDCQDIDLTGLGITYIKPFLFKNLDYAYNTILKSIVMPDVTDIGRESFKNCVALTSVTFGSRLKNIDSYAFHSCSKMVVSEIPGAQIQTGAFYGCSKIIDLKLGDGVSMGDEAFKMCSGLETLTIGANASINCSSGYEPFANCSVLNAVKVLGLPAKDKYTDKYYFKNIFSSSCSSLTDIYVSWPENTVPNAPWGAPSTVTVHYDTQFDDEGEPII